MQIFEAIQRNHDQVRDDMAQAAQQAGRLPEDIRLVVVTKTHLEATLRAALEIGIHDFGESYVEEAGLKIAAFEKAEITWHMIGHVQSRKAKQVAEQFNLVHSVDSIKLANRLNRFAKEARKVLPILLEINMSGESTKYGFPGYEQDNWHLLFDPLQAILNLDHLDVQGLMTIAPWGTDHVTARPYFQNLAELRNTMEKKLTGAHLPELSMGMSADYRGAIAEGATMLRIGSAILGTRPSRN